MTVLHTSEEWENDRRKKVLRKLRKWRKTTEEWRRAKFKRIKKKTRSIEVCPEVAQFSSPEIYLWIKRMTKRKNWPCFFCYHLKHFSFSKNKILSRLQVGQPWNYSWTFDAYFFIWETKRFTRPEIQFSLLQFIGSLNRNKIFSRERSWGNIVTLVVVVRLKV